MKKTAIIFGNAQAAAMARVLADYRPFADQYEIRPYKAVHVLSADERERLLADARTIDLLVHQPVSDVYAPATTVNLKASLNPEATEITFPVCWFDGYFPDMIHVRSAAGRSSSDLFDYHSRLVLLAYQLGMSQEMTVERYEAPDLYDPAFLEANVERNFTAMLKREAGLDVQITDFTRRRFRASYLYFTFNHPTGHVLYFVIDQVLRRLALPPLPPEVKKQHSGIMGAFRWKGAPSVTAGLKLTCATPTVFMSRDTTLTTSEFVEHYFRFYDEHPAVVDEAAKLPLNGLRLF